jgi:hypothetical protein
MIARYFVHHQIPDYFLAVQINVNIHDLNERQRDDLYLQELSKKGYNLSEFDKINHFDLIERLTRSRQYDIMKEIHFLEIN